MAVRTRTAVALLLALLACPAFARAQAEQNVDAQVLLAEGRRYFDALEYEHAVTALDRAIAIIEGRPAQDPARRLVAGAYEMRARSRFGLGDEIGAKADFVALLKADPSYGLTGQVSPRVVSLFQDLARTTVTTFKLAVTPVSAEVRLDGALVPSGGTMPMSVGEHVVSAKQVGYRATSETVVAESGKPAELTLALERISTVFAIVTAPPDVEVVIDGISHGKTAQGPPRADYAEAAARAGVPASSLSSVMTVADVPPGSHLVEFRRDCYVATERRVLVDKPDDYTLDPVKLDPAVASLTVRSTPPGLSVVVDGRPRGVTPFTTSDVCEGEHLVELRSATGRYFKRVDAHTGEKIDIAGTARPAFAILTASGSPELKADMRVAIERAFEASQSVTIFAPPADQVNQALNAQQLPAGWLAFDGNKRPMGASADIGAARRRDLSARLARTFDAQGVASVTVPPGPDRNRVIVALLGAGSGEPDVFEVNLENPELVANVVRQLDRPPVFFRPSIGLVAIDVADEPGAVVTSVDVGGPAAKAGILPSQVIVKVNGQAAGDAGALGALLANHKAGDVLSLELRDRTGAIRRVDVPVLMTPRLIGIADHTLLVNRMLVDLRARALVQSEPIEESVIRLNLAAALARVENWADARVELLRVKLPDGPGVANGTVQYLLGLCADKLGNRSEAETAWRAAAASQSLLTEDGPPVKELAEALLAQPQRR